MKISESVWEAWGLNFDMANDLRKDDPEDAKHYDKMAHNFMMLLLATDHASFQKDPEHPNERLFTYHEDGLLDEYIGNFDYLIDKVQDEQEETKH